MQFLNLCEVQGLVATNNENVAFWWGLLNCCVQVIPTALFTWESAIQLVNVCVCEAPTSLFVNSVVSYASAALKKRRRLCAFTVVASR